jgi:predicted CXXCH cytochrome family protein
MSRWGILLAVFALQAAEDGYIDPSTCKTCHQKIFETYLQTGMGRSFSSIASVPRVEDWDRNNSYYHKASDRHYRMFRAGGSYFLRRHQVEPKKGEMNVIEKQIEYVVGSGAHSRTYLSRGADGKLLELPLSWYSENGGYWAMSPGYDRPDHSDFRREVADSCLFCHNGYPSQANNGLAQGIDCQRCHGPGRAHASGKGAIVNPAKLSLERQMEVCMQCHLESASRTIPDSIRRYNRAAFSYRPGEPLGDFAIYFDYAGGRLRDESFEVNHSAYGLRKSLCFLRSKGAMTCTTCHDPHHALRGEQAKEHYTQVCRSCHSTEHAKAAADCGGCHMPKRRTTDAVHVIMTDHHIRRGPQPPDRLAPIAEKHERYSGDVALYYPGDLPNTPENRLYLAVAQVKDFTNLKKGIPLLEKAIAEARPAEAEFYFDLGQAYWSEGRFDDAIPFYRQAIERKPDFAKALNALGDTLLRRGEVDRAISVLEPALKKLPEDPIILNALAVAYGQKQRFAEALALLSKAVKVNPDIPLSWINLGVCLEQKGDLRGAESVYENAIRLQPDLDRARKYLQNLQRAQADSLN